MTTKHKANHPIEPDAGTGYSLHYHLLKGFTMMDLIIRTFVDCAIACMILAGLWFVVVVSLSLQ